jgi:hypothetical protein
MHINGIPPGKCIFKVERLVKTLEDKGAVVNPGAVTGGTGWSTRNSVAALGVLLAAVLVLYWRVLSKQFVYDDWIILYRIWKEGWEDTLRWAWDPAGGLHYRPLSRSYFIMMFALFGVSPFPAHLLTLCLHVLNGFLVVLTAGRLGIGRRGALLAGLFFVSLATLHLDPLLWLVGMYDIGVVTFTLLAILFFLDNRPAYSLTAVVFALLTKEAAAFLPLLLAGWAVLVRKPRSWLKGYLAVVVFYVLVKIAGTSPLGLESSHPYALVIAPSQILSSMWVYLTWLAGSLVPPLESRVPGFLTISFFVVVLVQWHLGRKMIADAVPVQTIGVLFSWLVLALMPVLFFVNQSARYYGIHAGIPLVLLAAIVCLESVPALTRIGRNVLLTLIALIVLASNWLFVERSFSRGIQEQIINDGRFHLVKRTASVDSVYENLFRRYPAVPRNATITITGIPLDAIGGGRAVQLWYRDSTLVVRSGVDTTAVAGDEESVANQRVRVHVGTDSLTATEP